MPQYQYAGREKNITHQLTPAFRRGQTVGSKTPLGNRLWLVLGGVASQRPSSFTLHQAFFFNTNLNLNGELARILVKNKHFTRVIFERAGIKNIPFILPESMVQLEQFFRQYRPLICKPLLGQRSEKIKLLKTIKQLHNCSLERTFFEKYIEGVEHRCLVLQDEVIAMQRKELRPKPSNPWQLYYIGLLRKNWRADLTEEAIKIARLFQLNWAGIDYLLDKQGSAWLLKVNSAPGIVKIHQPDEGVKINAARLLWQAVIDNGPY